MMPAGGQRRSRILSLSLFTAREGTAQPLMRDPCRTTTFILRCPCWYYRSARRRRGSVGRSKAALPRRGLTALKAVARAAVAVMVVVVMAAMVTLVGLPAKLPRGIPKRPRVSRHQEKLEGNHTKKEDEARCLPENIHRGTRQKKTWPLAVHRPPRSSLTPLATQAQQSRLPRRAPQGPPWKEYREPRALPPALEAKVAGSWGVCDGHGRSRRPRYHRDRGFFLRRSRRGKGCRKRRVPRMSQGNRRRRHRRRHRCLNLRSRRPRGVDVWAVLEPAGRQT